jgi:hypothetical protein
MKTRGIDLISVSLENPWQTATGGAGLYVSTGIPDQGAATRVLTSITFLSLNRKGFSTVIISQKNHCGRVPVRRMCTSGGKYSTISGVEDAGGRIAASSVFFSLL